MAGTDDQKESRYKMFKDNARIFVKAGNGGNGCVSFHREKYVANGGPDGGDGGRGGNVIFRVNEGLHTLADFRYKRHYRASAGEDGGSSNCSGRNGEDLIVLVPPGTTVKDEATEIVLADLTLHNQEEIIAMGGKGGKGNQHFATSTRQVPVFAKSGQPGEERYVQLELKVLADVGLIGFPSVGKSTLLSVVSAATPRIAEYHFTTLEPNLGVVSVGEGQSFVLADLPGLIEGAHLGTGLGIEFLKHTERTKLLLHILDMASIEGRNPVEDYRKINMELEMFSSTLASKPQIVVANKMDIPGAAENLDNFIKESGLDRENVFPISGVTKAGVSGLMRKVFDTLQQIPSYQIPPEDTVRIYTAKKQDEYSIRTENGVYIIEGEWARKLMGSVNLSNYESLQYFQRALRKKGIIDKLEDMGVNEGDTVRILDFEFDYVR